MMINPVATQELRSILEATDVGEMPLSGYPVLTPALSLMNAVSEMRRTRHGSALVCDNGKVVGIFTERDFLRVLNSGNIRRSLAEVMTKNPKTVTMQDTLFTAAQLMNEGGYRRLPVVNEDGSPAGVLDVKTISHFLVEHFPEAIYNQASREQLLARHREGA